MIELLHLDFYKTEFRKCNVPHGTLHSAFKSRYPPTSIPDSIVYKNEGFSPKYVSRGTYFFFIITRIFKTSYIKNSTTGITSVL